MGSISLNNFNEYDIFIAYVPFEDLPQEKIRPVLILKEGVYLIDCLKMTSAKTRFGEYELKEWQKAGLDRQTTVRITKCLKLDKTKFIKKIGHLTPIDIMEIQRLLVS